MGKRNYNQMKRISYYLALLLPIIFSCQDVQNDQTVYFVGDSMIANWDVEASFPNKICKNIGRDGAGINYLNDIHTGDGITIILIGTNDLKPSLDEKHLLLLFESYKEAILKITTKSIFLISILPTNDTKKNFVIQKFNTLLGNWATTNNQITFVDSYQQFLNEKGVISYDLTRDGIHLNDYGYIILTNQVKSKGKWN